MYFLTVLLPLFPGMSMVKLSPVPHQTTDQWAYRQSTGWSWSPSYLSHDLYTEPTGGACTGVLGTSKLTALYTLSCLMARR